MYVGMIETRSLKILLKNFHENYSDLLKKSTVFSVFKCVENWFQFQKNLGAIFALEVKE